MSSKIGWSDGVGRDVPGGAVHGEKLVWPKLYASQEEWSMAILRTIDKTAIAINPTNSINKLGHPNRMPFVV